MADETTTTSQTTTEVDSPYHPGCVHRYEEKLDHEAIVGKLNAVADQCYRLLQMCDSIREDLSKHNVDDEAHLDIRRSLDEANTRITKAQSDLQDNINTLENKHDRDISSQNTRNDSQDRKLTELSDNLASVMSGEITYEAPIASAVSDRAAVSAIKDGNTMVHSTAEGGATTFISDIASPSGKFATGVTGKNYVVSYLSNADSSSNGGAGTSSPTSQVTLLDEHGNASFPGSVSAANGFTGKLNGNAATSSKWANPIRITIRDSAGNVSSTALLDGSGNVTFSLPSSMNAPGGFTGNLTGNVTGNVTGNADTATKLKTTVTINGVSFDGSKNIITTTWGASRNLKVATYNQGYIGSAVSVNGSTDATLLLPTSWNGDYVSANNVGVSGTTTSDTINSTTLNNSGNLSTTYLYVNGIRIWVE